VSWVNFDLAASGQPYGVRETCRHPATAKLHLDLGYLNCAFDNRAVAVPTHELDRDLVLDGIERAEVHRGLDLGGESACGRFTVTLPVDWGERPAGFTSSGCGSTRRCFCGGAVARRPVYHACRNEEGSTTTGRDRGRCGFALLQFRRL